MAKSKSKQTKPDAQVGSSNATSTAIEPVRRPMANAGPCPKNAAHTNTRIYTTKGTTRYAVCDDCGETWKVIGQRTDKDKQYLSELADSFADATAVTTGGLDVICIDVKLRNQIVQRLREIAGA